mgnify:CR=1 FL=1
MAANDTELRVRIEGEDRTKAATNSVTDNLKRLGQVISSALVFDKLKQGIKDTIDASIKMENAVIGLSSVSRAMGQDIGQTTQAAKNLAADGLKSVTDAASGLKNLLASGFSLPEAIQLMNGFKDTAAFNRQGMLGFGEAIVGATQGIKNQNSIMVDNAGVTKNLSVILKEAGLSVNDLGKVSSDAGVRQKMLGGLLKETAVSAGDAARMTQTLGGQQAQLSATIFTMKAKIGDIIRVAYQPMIQKMNQWLQTNPKLAISLVIAAGAAAATAAAVVGLAGAFALAQMAGGPLTIILLALSMLVGVVVFKAMGKLQDKMAGMTDTFVGGSDKIADSTKTGLGAARGEADKTAEQLRKLGDQVKKSERDFKESMVKIVQDHLKKSDELSKQLGDENEDFQRSQEDKERSFKRSQASMVKDHERKVKEIKDQIKEEEDRQSELTANFADKQEDMTRSHERRVADITKQIDQETAKGSKANQERLDDLRTRLDRENEDYNSSFADLQADYEQDTRKAKTEHDKKLADLQARLTQEEADHTAQVNQAEEDYKRDTENAKREHEKKLAEIQGKLDEERAFLEKHGQLVNEMKSVQLLDEIEMLQRSNKEQMEEYEEHKKDIIKNAKQTMSGMASAFVPTGDQLSMLNGAGSTMGSTMATAFKEAFSEVWNDFWSGWKNKASDAWSGLKAFANTGSITGDIEGTGWKQNLGTFWNNIKLPTGGFGPKKPGGGGFAVGGVVRKGIPIVTGEHGREVFTPTQDGYITPSHRLGQMSGGGITIHQTNHIYRETDPLAAARALGFELATR